MTIANHLAGLVVTTFQPGAPQGTTKLHAR